jgi:hypothetical protein
LSTPLKFALIYNNWNFNKNKITIYYKLMRGKITNIDFWARKDFKVMMGDEGTNVDIREF